MWSHPSQAGESLAPCEPKSALLQLQLVASCLPPSEMWRTGHFCILAARFYRSEDYRAYLSPPCAAVD